MNKMRYIKITYKIFRPNADILRGRPLRAP